MNFLYSDEPIIACSTCNHAHAALSVLRISGFQSLSQFQKFFAKDLGPIEPRKVYYTKMLHRGSDVDDICLTYFEGPKSYNGENILELSIHGNTLNTELILELFVNEGGCRLASPGEFTYRAMKNKKLSLSQVEGLDLFLNANSKFALDQGLSLLSGNLQEIYQELYDLFLVHKSSLELSIDFSDDIGEKAAKDYFDNSLEKFALKFQTLVKRVLPMEHNLIQPEIVLAGLPNSGKSSLFNKLLSDDRAIVSNVAGTTRDYLAETILIEGVKYRLIDTAGIRESQDAIEAEGMRRTKLKMRQSFFSILLINPLEMVAGFDKLLDSDFDLMLFTHADVGGFEEAKIKLLKKHPSLGSIGATNIQEIGQVWEKNLHTLINKKYLNLIKDKPILLDRHKSLILKADVVLGYYRALSAVEGDVAILSMELNTLGHCISELIGIVSPDQVLNSIFSNFCIGK